MNAKIQKLGLKIRNGASYRVGNIEQKYGCKDDCYVDGAYKELDKSENLDVISAGFETTNDDAVPFIDCESEVDVHQDDESSHSAATTVSLTPPITETQLENSLKFINKVFGPTTDQTDLKSSTNNVSTTSEVSSENQFSSATDTPTYIMRTVPSSNTETGKQPRNTTICSENSQEDSSKLSFNRDTPYSKYSYVTPSFGGNKSNIDNVKLDSSISTKSSSNISRRNDMLSTSLDNYDFSDSQNPPNSKANTTVEDIYLQENSNQAASFYSSYGSYRRLSHVSRSSGDRLSYKNNNSPVFPKQKRMSTIDHRLKILPQQLDAAKTKLQQEGVDATSVLKDAIKFEGKFS